MLVYCCSFQLLQDRLVALSRCNRPVYLQQEGYLCYITDGASAQGKREINNTFVERCLESVNSGFV